MGQRPVLHLINLMGQPRAWRPISLTGRRQLLHLIRPMIQRLHLCLMLPKEHLLARILSDRVAQVLHHTRLLPSHLCPTPILVVPEIHRSTVIPSATVASP